MKLVMVTPFGSASMTTPLTNIDEAVKQAPEWLTPPPGIAAAYVLCDDQGQPISSWNGADWIAQQAIFNKYIQIQELSQLLLYLDSKRSALTVQ